MRAPFSRILHSDAPRAVLLIRILVGAVFLSEGIQKFLFPDDPDRGTARFAEIGIPLPEAMAMLVAIATTKIPILVEGGFWDMAHAARTDWSMLLGSIFLLCTGAGATSLDARIARQLSRDES
jgi:putative oxidoreductase